MTNKKTVTNKDRDAALENFKGFRFGPEDALEFIPTGHPVLDQTIASGHIVSKDKANEMSETTTGGLPRGKFPCSMEVRDPENQVWLIEFAVTLSAWEALHAGTILNFHLARNLP